VNEVGATLYRWEDIPKTEMKPGLNRRFISTERLMVTHLYLDEGSKHFRISGNVVETAGKWLNNNPAGKMYRRRITTDNIATGNTGSGRRDIVQHERLECAIAVTEQDGNTVRGSARRYVTTDVMHHRQVELAVAVEIRRRDGGRIESGSVWKINRWVEGSRAGTGKQCEAQLRIVQRSHQIHLAVAIEITRGHRLRVGGDRKISFRAERSIAILVASRALVLTGRSRSDPKPPGSDPC